jgi:hypothetical protein
MNTKKKITSVTAVAYFSGFSQVSTSSNSMKYIRQEIFLQNYVSCFSCNGMISLCLCKCLFDYNLFQPLYYTISSINTMRCKLMSTNNNSSKSLQTSKFKQIKSLFLLSDNAEVLSSPEILIGLWNIHYKIHIIF